MTKKRQDIHFSTGTVSYLTSKFKRANLSEIIWKNVEGNILRLEFSRCSSRNIFQSIYGMFRLTKNNLNNLVFLKVAATSYENFSVSMLKLLKYLNSLESLYFYVNQLTSKFVFALHDVVLTKAAKNKPINVYFVNLYYSGVRICKDKEKFGLLFEGIASSCKEYFCTSTEPKTNILYFKHFMRSADKIKRKHSENIPKIYLGPYISKKNDPKCAQYAEILNAAGLKLFMDLENRSEKKLESYYW